MPGRCFIWVTVVGLTMASGEAITATPVKSYTCPYDPREDWKTSQAVERKCLARLISVVRRVGDMFVVTLTDGTKKVLNFFLEKQLGDFDYNVRFLAYDHLNHIVILDEFGINHPYGTAVIDLVSGATLHAAQRPIFSPDGQTAISMGYRGGVETLYEFELIDFSIRPPVRRLQVNTTALEFAKHMSIEDPIWDGNDRVRFRAQRNQSGTRVYDEAIAYRQDGWLARLAPIERRPVKP
jgi:hypothetical protein